MSTNAQAWNYLGVADEYAGHPADAVLAYQRALTLDRDLVEAHYNLGCLWLEQNKPDVARTEFIAYVLRRSKESEGWTKLGVAQLRLRDLASAEKNFNLALSINTNDAEALNGLGLAQMQWGHPREAARYFTAAAQAQPDYAPALLNLATVARQYLHDSTLALQNYRTYLALTPRRADWDQVNTLASDLEQQTAGTAAASLSNAQRPTRPVASTWAPSTADSSSDDAADGSSSAGAGTRYSSSLAGRSAAAETPPPGNGKPGAFRQLNPLNWFRTASPEPKVTRLAPANANNDQEQAAGAGSQRPDSFRHAHAQSDKTRPPGSARAAGVSAVFVSFAIARPGRAAGWPRDSTFAQAQQFERDRQYRAALDSYRAAAQLDPSWFEAQYNCGVLAYRLGDFDQSLPAYEMALALRPDSADARYNFALALKAAGYVTDAVNELNKILASHPGDVRAHLALGNLYARQLYDLPRARAQYLRVLQLDPRNSQAADIQFWLSANPP